MRVIALADFGSTFTKVTVVEDGSGRLLAQAHHPTTIGTDVMEGYHIALKTAMAQLDGSCDLIDELAASSAGGGLRMAAVGLVDVLTAEAARHAALNAGAKVELVAAGDLDATDRTRLAEVLPEVLLFCGGTDGGQRKKVLDNAAAIAPIDGLALVVVACNADIAPAVAEIFERPGRTVHVVDNVLPTIDRLSIEPARRAIHDLFIHHVIGGKRLSSGDAFAAMVRKPTPEAVLDAVRLLATWQGEDDEPDGVVVVDVGGATTDIHSAMSVDDRPAYITPTGLPILPLTRSVQGDLGMRWGAESVVNTDRAWLRSALDMDDAALDGAARTRRERPEWLATTDAGHRADDALTVSCIHLAMQRHCGTMTANYLPGQGTQFVQRGLDLRKAPLLVGTGGPLVRRARAEKLLTRALERCHPESLAPVAPTIAVDHCYVLAAAGLLSTHDRQAARGLLDHLRRDLHAHRSR
jgi:uncharacterized protein (TIGR01319 family)